MRKPNYHQIVPSTMKVVASTDLNIEEDLKDNNTPNKSISELLNEQEKATEEKTD
tara:strand:+ start:8694 stop:8858 length:165 start_codon:yes stop_codon:yes gene_type:complete